MTQLDFSKELNKAQYEVVSSGNGPHLVLAGAGSGKTRTLVYRTAWLISQGVPANKILLLTFTNKAANQMMTRVKSILNLKTFSLWGGTFHSMANRLLRIYGKYIDIEPDFTILDTDDTNNLIKAISKDIFGSISEKRKPSSSLIRETISYSVNAKVSLEESLEMKFSEWLPVLPYIEKIAREYKRRKKLSNVLDFDDLLIYWLKLTKHPEAGKLLAKKWDHVLVDEYQDTNLIQAEIIFNLSKTHQNILVVGDDDQSIYSFRAANIKNILNFPKKFKQCQMYKLETNYRSSPQILNLANQIISFKDDKFKKSLNPVKDSFNKPELVALRSNLEEAWFVANRIEGLIAGGLKPYQIAVLFRAASSSQSLEMELNKRGIEYEMRGGLKFFARAHIKDVLSHLKILGNFRDEVAWLRVLQLYEGIGPMTAQQIYQQIAKADSLDKLKLNMADRAANSWSKLYGLVTTLIKYKDKGISKLLNLIVDHYIEYLREKYADYKYREADLEQLVLFASEYTSLGLFLNEISLQESFSVKEARQDNKDAVILSTVHQAKGLEWPAVFVINMTNQSFPHPFCVRAEEQEEERRLFYVALTRSKKFLYVYSLENKNSMFLNEINPYLMNIYIDTGERWHQGLSGFISNYIKGISLEVPMICPRCGRLLTERTRKDNGRKFIGCTGFSATGCKYTYNLEVLVDYQEQSVCPYSYTWLSIKGKTLCHLF